MHRWRKMTKAIEGDRSERCVDGSREGRRDTSDENDGVDVDAEQPSRSHDYKTRQNIIRRVIGGKRLVRRLVTCEKTDVRP